MPTINLGTPGIRQDFTVEEGSAFGINFTNNAGNFPADTCAVLTLVYNEFDQSSSLMNSLFNDQSVIPVTSQNSLIRTQYFYNGKRSNINLISRITSTPNFALYASSKRPAPAIYNPFKDYSLLTLSLDTISLGYPSDMTTLKRLPETLYSNTAPSQGQQGVTWNTLVGSVNSQDAYFVDSYNLFSMMFLSAKYELTVITPTNRYRPVYGTITKNKPFIINSNNFPTCN